MLLGRTYLTLSSTYLQSGLSTPTRFSKLMYSSARNGYVFQEPDPTAFPRRRDLSSLNTSRSGSAWCLSLEGGGVSGESRTKLWRGVVEGVSAIAFSVC
jgi:hypothetical protein